MKKLLPVVAMLLVGVAFVQGASAAAGASLEARMNDCLRVHGHLMEKPGLRNRLTCWWAHSYLMER